MGGNINIQQLTQRGQWLFGMDWTAGPLYVTHEVLPDQLEVDPNTGRVRPLQAQRHEVWLWSMNLNLFTQLGITSWMNVRLQLPLRFVQVTARFQDAQGRPLENFRSIHHRDEILVGVGDPDARIAFRPFQTTRHQPWFFEFGAGVSFPLGRIETDPYQAGREGKEHQHIMFGTGTFDPIGFLSLGYIAPIVQAYLQTSIQGAVYANKFQYQEGLRFQASLAVESGFGLKTWSFLAQASFVYLAPGLWSGRVDPDSLGGRTDILLTAGVYWRPTPAWQLNVRASFPINLALQGGELSQPVILGVGMSYQFRIFK